MWGPCTETPRLFHSPGLRAFSPSAVGIATQPRPPLSYNPPVCLPMLGSTSTCIPSMSGPCSGFMPVIREWTKTPLFPSASPLNLRRKTKFVYVLLVVKYPYLFAVLSHRIVPWSATHFSSPLIFQPDRSLPLKRAVHPDPLGV